MSTRRHIGIDLRWLRRRIRETGNRVLEVSGVPMADPDAILYLDGLISEGQTTITAAECGAMGPDGGCLGHTP